MSGYLIFFNLSFNICLENEAMVYQEANDTSQQRLLLFLFVCLFLNERVGFEIPVTSIWGKIHMKGLLKLCNKLH